MNITEDDADEIINILNPDIDLHLSNNGRDSREYSKKTPSL